VAEQIDPSLSSTPLDELDDGSESFQAPTWALERLKCETPMMNADESNDQEKKRHE
jgi:hypothetical protein